MSEGFPMLNRILLTAVALGVVGVASPAWAAPMIDGSVGTGEYATVLNDAAPESGEDYYNSGLDIKSLHFDNASGWYWTGLTVVNAPIDTDGDPTSFVSQSWFGSVFYDATHTTPYYRVMILMGGVAPIVALEEWNGSAWDTVLLGGSDYDVSVGTALEVRISQSKMPSMPATPYVSTQLDGTGSWGDDQLAGVVPEPATIGLMGLGLVATLVKRRRK